MMYKRCGHGLALTASNPNWLRHKVITWRSYAHLHRVQFALDKPLPGNDLLNVHMQAHFRAINVCCSHPIPTRHSECHATVQLFQLTPQEAWVTEYTQASQIAVPQSEIRKKFKGVKIPCFDRVLIRALALDAFGLPEGVHTDCSDFSRFAFLVFCRAYPGLLRSAPICSQNKLEPISVTLFCRAFLQIRSTNWGGGHWLTRRGGTNQARRFSKPSFVLVFTRIKHKWQEQTSLGQWSKPRGRRDSFNQLFWTWTSLELFYRAKFYTRPPPHPQNYPSRGGGCIRRGGV